MGGLVLSTMSPLLTQLILGKATMKKIGWLLVRAKQKLQRQKFPEVNFEKVLKD